MSKPVRQEDFIRRAVEQSIKTGTISLEELTNTINSALRKSGQKPVSSATVRQKLNGLIRQMRVSVPALHQVRIVSGQKVAGRQLKTPTTSRIIGTIGPNRPNPPQPPKKIKIRRPGRG
jgi:hypothetical protein